MRKILALSILFTMALAACGNPSDIEALSKTENQLEVIAENKDFWDEKMDYANEVYQYAVTDLDHNGRLEIIVSNMGGTGIYTYSRFYEISETFDGLTECETDFVEGYSQPDIMSMKLETCLDKEGQYQYVVYDTIRNGAAEYHENIKALSLQEGKVVTTPIAYSTSIYTEGEPNTSFRDCNGEELTEEEYLAAVKNYFADYTLTLTAFGWQNVNELSNNKEEMITQLETSLNIFLQEEELWQN